MNRVKLIGLVIAGLLLGQTVFANSFTNYDDKTFMNAQKMGKTVVLDFHADWCPTCQKQKPVLESLIKQKNFKNVVALRVDYDNADMLKKKFKVNSQSTIIVLKGNKEVARVAGVSDKTELMSLIQKGI